MRTLVAAGRFPAFFLCSRFGGQFEGVQIEASGFCLLPKYIEGCSKNLVQFVPETLIPDVPIARVRKTLILKSETATA